MADLDGIDADQKEAYFLRLNLLLVKYGTEILKDVFNWKIPPDTLHAELQNQRRTINYCKTKLNVITKRQEAKLYPQYHAPTSNDFDISLLVTLLRHICPGFNKGQTIKNLWEENDNTKIQVSPTSDKDIRIVADIVRIRNIRNMLQHQNCARLEQKVFEDTWNEVADTIIRLSTPCSLFDYVTNIEELKTKTLELVPTEVLNMRSQSIAYFDEFIEQEGRYFVDTVQYRKAAQVLDAKQVVIITGHPGEGKTTIATRLALEKTQPRNCLILKQPQDWRRVNWSLKVFDTIIIDDIFGSGSLDQRLVDEWKPFLPEIELAIKQHFLRRAIITTRHYIYEESRQFLDSKVDMFKMSADKEDSKLVLLTTKQLTETERKDILYSQAKRNNTDLSVFQIQDCVTASMEAASVKAYLFDSTFKREEFAFGFPECASMYVRNKTMLATGSKFFRQPAALFKTYLEDLYRDKTRDKQDKFLALVAVWASESGRIAVKELRNKTLASEHMKRVVHIYYGTDVDNDLLDKMKTSLESHNGGFLVFHENSGDYAFSHNVIGDMIGVVVGKREPEVAIELCPRDFLMEHVCLADDDLKQEYMVVVQKQYFDDLAKKFACMILRRECNRISKKKKPYEILQFQRDCLDTNEVYDDIDYGITNHRAFRNRIFVDSFIEYIKKEELTAQLLSVPVMKMTEHFFHYGIKLKTMVLYLTGYAIYRHNTVLAMKLINANLLGSQSMDPSMMLLLATHSGDKEMIDFLLLKGATVTEDTIYVATQNVIEDEDESESERTENETTSDPNSGLEDSDDDESTEDDVNNFNESNKIRHPLSDINIDTYRRIEEYKSEDKTVIGYAGYRDYKDWDIECPDSDAPVAENYTVKNELCESLPRDTNDGQNMNLTADSVFEVNRIDHCDPTCRTTKNEGEVVQWLPTNTIDKDDEFDCMCSTSGDLKAAGNIADTFEEPVDINQNGTNNLSNLVFPYFVIVGIIRGSDEARAMMKLTENLRAEQTERIDVLEKLLVHTGVDINDKGHIINGNVPLIVASKKGKQKVVQCLLQHGADPSIKNDKYMTALHKAVIYDHIDIIKLLLEYNAPLDVKGGQFKRTPLHIAADVGHTDIVRLLLDKGASVNVKDHRGHYPIFVAAFNGKKDVVKAMLLHDKSQDQLQVVSYGTKSIIKGMSLYHVCILRRKKKMLKVLLKMKADPNIRDREGQTPLMYAIVTGAKMMATKLLKADTVNKNLPQKQGYTPLHTAIHKGFDRIAKLLALQVNVNTRDIYGRTALHVACEKGNLDIVHFLLKKCRADPRMVTKRGDTVYHILRRKKNNEKHVQHAKRRAIEILLNQVDPTFADRLPNLPNRVGIVILNANPVFNSWQQGNLNRMIQKLCMESGDDDEFLPPPKPDRKKIVNPEDKQLNVDSLSTVLQDPEKVSPYMYANNQIGRQDIDDTNQVVTILYSRLPDECNLHVHV